MVDVEVYREEDNNNNSSTPALRNYQIPRLLSDVTVVEGSKMLYCTSVS